MRVKHKSSEYDLTCHIGEPDMPINPPREPSAESEIEITPEMISRGEKVLMECRDLMYETSDQVVRWIIREVLGSRVKFLGCQ